MRNKDFYAYCRDHRSTEPSLARREALHDVYNFMQECDVSKNGVKEYIERMMRESRSNYNGNAYQWLLDVSDGSCEPVVPDRQMQLF
jgi:hypothetical protein